MEPNTNEETQAGGRRPTHIAYWIKDRENQKGVWHPIGVAWAHVDGKGFSLALDLQPRDGRITVRVLEEKADREESRASVAA
jgi:hypothetical protein